MRRRHVESRVLDSSLRFTHFVEHHRIHDRIQSPVRARVVPSCDKHRVTLSNGDREVVDGVRSELDLERGREKTLVSFVVKVGLRKEMDTNSISLDDLHIMSIDPDVEHSESGH